MITENGTYRLKNGKTLQVTEDCCEGMAGEPMSIIWLKIDGNLVRFNQVKDLLDPEDAQELLMILDDASDTNEANAHAWAV